MSAACVERHWFEQSQKGKCNVQATGTLGPCTQTNSNVSGTHLSQWLEQLWNQTRSSDSAPSYVTYCWETRRMHFLLDWEYSKHRMKTVCISSVFSPPVRLWKVLKRNNKECQGKGSTEIQWLKPDTHAECIKVSPSSLHPIQYFAPFYWERTNCLLHLCSLSLETTWRGYTGKPDYNSSSWSTLGPGPVEKLKATDPHPRKMHTPKHLVKFKTPHGILSSQLGP